MYCDKKAVLLLRNCFTTNFEANPYDRQQTSVDCFGLRSSMSPKRCEIEFRSQLITDRNGPTIYVKVGDLEWFERLLIGE